MPAAAPEPRPSSSRVVAQTDLVEPLTHRELAVLVLLAQRLSAREIAQHLTISERTAKRHTANIYQKLAVNNRKEAVAAASALASCPWRNDLALHLFLHTIGPCHSLETGICSRCHKFQCVLAPIGRWRFSADVA